MIVMNWILVGVYIVWGCLFIFVVYVLDWFEIKGVGFWKGWRIGVNWREIFVLGKIINNKFNLYIWCRFRVLN